MDLLLKDLMSTETMGKLAAVEKTASKLANRSWLKDVPNDTKMKLMNASISTVKDANPKIVIGGLNCLDLLIKNYKDDFSPMIAMSFELLLAKLGDAKAAIREQALEVTLNLIGIMGLAAAFAAISSNINHKNQRVKESLLRIISRLQVLHGTELRSVVSAVSICKTIAPLLNDSVGALRQLAITTLAELYQTYGEDIMAALSGIEMRPAQQKLLLQAIFVQQKALVQPQTQQLSAPHSTVDELDPWSLLNDEEDFSYPTKADKSRLSPTAVPREQREGFGNTHGGLGDAGVSTSKPPVRRSLSATQRRPAPSQPLPSALTSIDSHQFGSTVGARSTTSSASFDTLPSGSEHMGKTPTSCYDPSGFMGFIQLKQGTKPTEIVDEKDLQKLTSKIAADLGKKTDWEARTNALVALQKLAWGNLRDYKNCVDIVKGMHDLISTQIIDLRSTVSKEACKAVAALAYSFRQQFSLLAELWWLQLVRVVVVKIQVISSSADRCIRVVVACCQDQRLLNLIMEACGNKNPPLRKLSLEYLALACASWRADIIEKNINAIKQVVRVAVADADSGARKTARQLYWVLHNAPALQSHMKVVFADLELPIQRHITAEATTDSPEMSDLFLIVQNPACLLDYARNACAGTSKEEGCEEDKECSAPLKVQSDAKPARAASAKPAARSQAAHSAVRSSNDTLGSQISEQDSSARDEICANSSVGVASTAMKSSRRLSLTAGPVRLTQPASAPVPATNRDCDDAGIAMKTPSVTLTAMGSRRLSLQSHMMPPPGRSLARSTDFSSGSVNDDFHSSDAAQGVASGATTITVSSLLSIPHSHNGSSMLSQGAVRNLDAKTPAVKSAAGGAGTRPSLFSTHMPPAIEEESPLKERELPSTSTSVAVSAESLRLGSLVDDFTTHAPATTPAVPSSAYVNRRASLGAFPTAGGAGSNTGTLNTGVSSLMNGPKRIIRAAPAPEPAATRESDERPVGAVAVRGSHQTVAATPAPSTQRPSVLLSNQVGAHLATAAESAVKVAAAEAEDRKKPVSHTDGHAENGVFVFSGETLRTMVEDTQWSTRVKAFESINMRLQRAISSSEALNEGMIETFVDLCLPHLADPHHKVSADALQVLQTCIASFPHFIKSRLGAILLALFHRLADRRPAIRDQANSILNLMRSTLDSVQIMAALSPRMGEVPDRMKTALLQFMGAIAPHCDEFFLHAANTWAFLSRMAHIISGSGGTKPSVTLTVAARRLLELVFKTSPVMMCSQIAALPFQQQIALKKFLEASVPDIDFQVMQASKAEWTGKAHAPVAPKASTASAAEGLLNTLSMSAEVDFHASLPVPPSSAAAQSTDYSADSWDQVESSFDKTAESSVFELHTRADRLDRLSRRVENEDSVLNGTVSTVSLEDTVPSCDVAVKHSSPAAVSKTAATELISKVSAMFSPPPPAPAAMSFTPRNLSAAAIEAEVRTLEYLDACQHSRSPSENVSPNSPDFRKKPLAAVADSKAPLFATLDNSALSAVLASKRAIDIATEEIIQRYSPTKTPSPVLASTLSVVDSILDPTSDYLHAALYNAYSDSKSVSVKSPTPTRPSQLPQRKSPSSNNSHSAEDGVGNQHVEAEQSSPENTGPHKSVVHAVAPPHHGTLVKSTPQKKATTATPVVATPPSMKPSHTTIPSQNTTPAASAASVSKAPSSASKATPVAKAAAKAPAATPTAPPAPTKKDTFWLLESLKPSAVLAVREEASRELKLRIKSSDDSYWLQNYAQIVTVLLESFRPDGKDAGSRRAGPLAGYEHMECSTKSLLLLMRYRGAHMKNLLEVLVDKLCRSASFAPAPISQTLEGVLSELGRHDAPRLVKALLPYVTFTSDAVPTAAVPVTGSVDVGAAGSVGECPQVRLMALHVLCNAVRFLTSAQLLSELPTAVPAVLSSVNSSLADLRKAVVFILVEMYLTVGDSVFPYVHSLTPPQRKLLTIYIEKRMNERKNMVTAAQQS